MNSPVPIEKIYPNNKMVSRNTINFFILQRVPYETDINGFYRDKKQSLKYPLKWDDERSKEKTINHHFTLSPIKNFGKSNSMNITRR